MADGDLGLVGAVSIALGGMIGGGIYAVLGVVVSVTGGAIWLSFIGAGVVAGCAAYSYDALNHVDAVEDGGSVTFLQQFVGNATLSGTLGWTLLVGYVGSMAMYAFAFGEFATGLPVVPAAVAGVALRPALSVAAVAGFASLNLAGARTTGRAETVLVAGKVLVLVAFGVAGIGFVTGAGPPTFAFGRDRLASFDPVMAAAISFVAFQGWQLLFYDQERIGDATATIRKAISVSIPVAVAVYVLVGVATVSIAPEALQRNPHTALATAAGNVLAPVGLASLGSLVISLSALFSTGSAINATLFSTGYFAKNLLRSGLLPDRVGDPDADGVPSRTLVALAVVTAAFSVYGSLSAITSFASLSFLVVFGAVSYLAFTQRDREDVAAVVPALGVVGTSGFFVLLVVHLFRSERATFYAVASLAVAVVALELLYFEREFLESEVPLVDAKE